MPGLVVATGDLYMSWGDKSLLERVLSRWEKGAGMWSDAAAAGRDGG